jgi:hypothetical protein
VSLPAVKAAAASVDVGHAQCSDGHVGDEEELLQPARPRLPRRMRLAALLLAVLAIAALIAIRVWPRSTHPSAAVPPRTSSVPSAVSPSTPETTSTPPPWPTAPGACIADAVLPIVSSTPVNEHTGLTVLLGGNRLRTVDFDSGRVTAMPGARLRSGEFVVGLVAASQTYAWTGACAPSRSRFLRLGSGGDISNVTLPSSIDAVLIDAARAWGMSGPKNDTSSGYLVPLDGGRRVRLPAGMWSNLITDGVLVGDVGSPTGKNSLLLVDAATGRIRDNLGNGVPVAVGHGFVLWTVGCDPSLVKPCTVHRRSVAGGATSSYRLPRPPCCEIGVLSPDGRLVAFPLERAAQDPRYQSGHPLPPSDIAILHLDTGRLEIVPGVEVPAKTSPGLAFSADARWLVIALDAGPKIRLLAWRSGLAHPYESKPIAGSAMEPPPLVVLPPHTGG